MKNVHLLGISVAPEVEMSGEDVRPYLANYGSGETWREFGLEQYRRARRHVRRSILVFNVYREKVIAKPMFLKYRLSPQWEAIESGLEIPDDIDHDTVLVGLRASQEGDDALSRVRIEFGKNGDAPFTLGIGVSEPSYEIFERPKSTDNPLPISLQSRLDVSRSVECDLLVGMPNRSIVYSARVIVLPVIGEKASTILVWSLCFVGFIILAFSVGASRLDWDLTRQRKASESTIGVVLSGSPSGRTASEEV